MARKKWTTRKKIVVVAVALVLFVFVVPVIMVGSECGGACSEPGQACVAVCVDTRKVVTIYQYYAGEY